MLGKKVTNNQLLNVFRAISLSVLIVMVLEIISVESYVSIFKPSIYYANTRGIRELEFDQSGLFRAAAGFQSRFSFGLTQFRTSSLFLEPVTLANFTSFLAIFLISTFNSLSRLDRILHGSTLLLALATTSSRASNALTMVFFIGYFVFPLLPAFSVFFIMPACLLAGLCFVELTGADIDSGLASDDFKGRIALTMHHLKTFDLGTMFGFDAARVPTFMDSGYAYVIASFTFVGFMLLWVCAGAIIPTNSSSRRRCLIGLNIFIFANMMVSGTSVLSIKIAAPLWFLAGFFSERKSIKTGDIFPDT